jgi:hypothetical protein
VSIHADDEFSLRIALEGELDTVVPADGLAGVVIAQYRRTRRRRVAGAVGLVVVAAGIGVPLGLAGGSGGGPAGGSGGAGVGGKPAHGGAPEHGESVPRQHAGAASVIGWRAEHLVISASSLSPAGLVSLSPAGPYAIAA